VRALVAADGALRIEQRPTPVPVGDQVLVRVASAGVNRADLLQKVGAYTAPPGWPPDVLGLEFCGTVESAGPQAVGAEPGRRVFGIVGGGGHATHVLTRAELCAMVPDRLDLAEAGGIPEVFITAHDALVTRAGLRSGERVLIHGVGSGVGTAALQLAKALGATVVGTSRTPDKLDRARRLGLDTGILAGDDMVGAIGTVDVVMDLIGGDYLGVDVEVCSVTGRIVIVGLLGGAGAQLDLGALMRKRLTIAGTVLRSRPEHEKALATARFAREVVPLLESELTPVVDRVFAFDDAPEAYDYMSGNASFGKIVLRME
jgi:NADPH:quinone reductase-like Zn-dependent oxidoreductase